jgi:ketosteroid isomerase-like protein
VNRGDAEAFVATTTSDVEWEDSIFWSERVRTYRGRAELREWFSQVVVEPWERLHCGVEEIIEAPDGRLFFGGIVTACGKDSGVETRLRSRTARS